MRPWITLPGPPLLAGPTEPYLVEPAALDQVVGHVSTQGARVVTVDVAAARSAADVVDALKGVLPFPDWCAPGWDPVADAFDELVEAWPFPLALLVHGLDHLVAACPQLVLETTVRLAELSNGFAAVGVQLLVVHVWRAREPDFASFCLSVQRGLWGIIPASLRAVALGWREGAGLARFVFDDVLGEDENDLVAEVETEVLADFSEAARFTFTATSSGGEPLGLEPGESWWAYVRRPGAAGDAPMVRATASGNG